MHCWRCCCLNTKQRGVVNKRKQAHRWALIFLSLSQAVSISQSPDFATPFLTDRSACQAHPFHSSLLLFFSSSHLSILIPRLSFQKTSSFLDYKPFDYTMALQRQFNFFDKVELKDPEDPSKSPEVFKVRPMTARPNTHTLQVLLTDGNNERNQPNRKTQLQKQ